MQPATLVTRERPLPVGRLVAQVEGRGRVVEMAGG
jgi:hypothetical protein